MLAMTPLLVANLRSGNVPNLLVGLLLACGIAIAVLGPSFGTAPFVWSSLLWWVAGSVLLLAAAIFRVVSAGVAKFLIALIPWYGLEEYAPCRIALSRQSVTGSPGSSMVSTIEAPRSSTSALALVRVKKARTCFAVTPASGWSVSPAFADA